MRMDRWGAWMMYEYCRLGCVSHGETKAGAREQRERKTLMCE